MTIREAVRLLDAEIVQPVFEDADLSGAYTTDLLSDVLANAAAGDALITIQAHKNAVAVAFQAGIGLIVICNSRTIPGDMIAAAKDRGIAIARTGENQFTVSGRLYPWLGERGKAQAPGRGLFLKAKRLLQTPGR
jgi:hypothetical protein